MNEQQCFTVLLDKEGKIGLLCSFAYDILGYAQGSLTGADWFDVAIPTRIRDQLRPRFLSLIQEAREMCSYVNPVITRDGVEKLIFWRNTLLKTSEGEVLGSISIGRVLDDQAITEMADLAKEVESEICQLMGMGFIEVKSVDEDGYFCYASTQQHTDCLCEECPARKDCKVWQ